MTIPTGFTGMFRPTPGPALPPFAARSWDDATRELLTRLEKVTRPTAFQVNELAALSFVAGDPDLDARRDRLAQRWQR